jgi:hypothetical protein
MLMSRHGVTDGRSHARDSWGGYPATCWTPVTELLRGGVLLSLRAKFKTTFSDLTGRADEYREVAS